VSVATDGRNVVVGAPFESANGQSFAGHSYVFNALNGTLVSTLTSFNPEFYGQFGSAVAVGGVYIVVGALAETTRNHPYAGSAYVYATAGMPIARLTSNKAQKYGGFGCSVATDGSNIVVGAYRESSNGKKDAGNAYVFTIATLELTETLYSLNPCDMGFFSSAVAIYSGKVVVGAPAENSGGQSQPGNIYIFS